MNLQTAVIEFLANEFHMEPDSVTEDTTFEGDLGVKAQDLPELLRNLQEALDVTLPEEQVANITTVGQLLTALSATDEAEEV